MGIPVAERGKQGQTSLEYLLLLAVVAVIVIASFSPGSLISQVHNSAQGYYNTVSSVIMDSDGVNPATNQDKDNPSPINGGWCPITCPTGSGPSVIYGACECPFPSFGGAPCPGTGTGSTKCGAGQTCPGAFEISCTGVTTCGTCPTGQICNSSGSCVCGDGLQCGQPPTPLNSIPNVTCTACICPAGTTFSAGPPPACTSPCPNDCYTWNGTSCVPVQCGPNMWCNSAMPNGQQCECDSGTVPNPNGPGCIYPCQNECYTWNGNSCVPVQCGTNMWCNPAEPPSLECQCDANCTPCGSNCCSPGIGCVAGQCSGSSCAGPTCAGTCCAAGDECNSTTGACCAPAPACGSNTCGTDSCGILCGTCPPGQTCNNSGPGVCTTGCVPTTCTVSAPCGTDLGIDNCGGVCVGVSNQCPIDGMGQIGTCDNGQCICGTCHPVYPCGSTVGFDECGNPCTATPGTCPSPLTCVNDACGCQGGTCYATYPCGSTAGYDYCGNPCNDAVPGTCPTGYSCSSSFQCVCDPVGPCEPDYQCGSTEGWDANCITPCNDAPEGSCPQGENCTGAPNYECTSCVPNGTCTAPCGSTSGTDNCGNPCTTTSPGTTCPVGETCTSGVCVCTTPGICPTGAVCGPDTCGNANGCNGPNACPNGEVCSAGLCVPNCLACQTWNGTACVSTTSCGTNQCGTDSCGNGCGPDNGGCPTGQSCSSGQCCPTCESWNGSACAITTPCGTNQCGTDSCGNECGPDNGNCPANENCSAGQCVPNCLACQTWNGSACVSTTPCGTNQCGTDSCGNECGPDNGNCPTGQSCASGQCVNCPNCAGAACGGNDGCGGICQTGSCSGGGTCTAGQCEATFALLLTDYADCASCAQICSFLNLGGSCGTQADCGGQPGCPINFSQCTPDPSGEGWDCGSCLTETVSSGTPCTDGVASVISQVTSNQTYGTCGNNPTPGQATVTYTVVCNP
jgi:Flp pilus assembly pilin Flp